MGENRIQRGSYTERARFDHKNATGMAMVKDRRHASGNRVIHNEQLGMKGKIGLVLAAWLGTLGVIVIIGVSLVPGFPKIYSTPSA